MKEPNLIKVMVPPNKEWYEYGAGEGCWFIVDDRTKAAYDLDAIGGEFYGILDNDSYYYPGLMHGERLPIEMRGKRASVVPIEALQKWKARPVEEVLAEYAEYMAENNE